MLAALHGMLVAAATLFPQLEAWWPGLAVLSAAKASLKVLVLMPALILLPFSLWRTVWRHYRDVSIAAAVILLTFFPWRIFEFHWELQAKLAGHAVFQISRCFIATLSLLPAAEPVLSGPELSVTVTQVCSPMAAVHTFQVLFGIAAVWEWNRWNKRRLAVAYFGGLLFMVGVNVMRISIMLITGNLLSASLVLDYHTAFSWAFYALGFSAYFFCIQPWLQNSASATVEPAPAAAL
jgi:exosortase/archaeosortase family protein